MPLLKTFLSLNKIINFAYAHAKIITLLNYTKQDFLNTPSNFIKFANKI